MRPSTRCADDMPGMTKTHRDETRLMHAGRNPRDHHGIVNPPVYHCSTVLFPNLAAFEGRSEEQERPRYTYGRTGTPTSEAFETAVAELEEAHAAVSLPSGLAAIAAPLSAFLNAGDHLLMVDSVYLPTRRFCDTVLARFGVQTTYYDPAIGSGIADLITPQTRVIFLESPGSLTFEMQDVPAIVDVARQHGIVTMMDNTWATPLFFKPLRHGVTLSIHAATKYMVGHSDAMMGVVACDGEASYRTLKACSTAYGYAAGPDDLYMALRGMRTMAVRLRQHQDNALTVARWLTQRPEVDRVLYPALPEDPGHALWARDFSGASGLFSIVLNPVSHEALEAMVDGLELFPMGASWGGYESLLYPARPERCRTATAWTAAGPTLRLHIGLEHADDLIADLTRGFERLAAAGA